MKKQKSKHRRTWLGGRYPTPFSIDELGASEPVDVLVWLDWTDKQMVFAEVVPQSAGKDALPESLAQALESPLNRRPVHPDVIRISDPSVAAAVGRIAGKTIEVITAPTPELDEVAASMASVLGQGPPPSEAGSYLEGIDAETGEAFFRAADAYYRMQPWLRPELDGPIRLDAPGLGVDGACLAVIGSLGESIGLMVFPDLDVYDTFSETFDPAMFGHPDMEEFDWLVLDFESGADMPDELRRTVARRHWPVSAPDAFPDATSYNSRTGPRAPDAGELRILATAAAALARIADAPLAEIESWGRTVPLDDGTDVRLGIPYEPPPSEDSPLFLRILDYAVRRHADAWAGHTRAFFDPEEARELALPWSLYDYVFDGETAADRYVRDHPTSAADRIELAAQSRAWLSIWEVLEAVPGKSLTLTDLLSGETRRVRERTASEQLVTRDAILSRVVDRPDGPVLDGLHPRVLGPLDAADVVARARRRLRRKRLVPTERLRDTKDNVWLIKKWEDAVDAREQAASVPPVLTNTDGDALLFTRDHFRIDDGAAARVAAALGELPGSLTPDADDPDSSIDFLDGEASNGDGPGRKVLGTARFRRGTLTLETNSIPRADTLRASVETACGETITFLAREHEDPTSLGRPQTAVSAEETPPDFTPEETAELAALEHRLKKEHYTRWLDEPLPILANRTPREAVRTADGRREVEALLKEMENRELRGAGGSPFDFGWLWGELGL